MLKSWIFAALRINCRRENSDFAQDLNFLNICGESQSLQKFTTTTIKSSRNAIFPIIYPKYFPFAIITFLVNLNIHQIPLPRFILKVYCPIKLLNNELVCVMTQHRKVAADENIFVNTHNERRGGVTGRNGEIMQRRGTCSPGAASRVGRLQSAHRRASCFSLCPLLYSLKLVQNSRKTGKSF